MLAGVVGGNIAHVTRNDGWNPENLGQISTNGNTVYSFSWDEDFVPGTASASNTSAVWVIRTGGNIYVRVGGNDSAGFVSNYVRWYDTVGTNQGDPGLHTGTGTNVFTLGTDAGVTVNIYNATDSTVSETPTFGNVSGGSSYTSDNKSTFFTPTADTKYGRQVDTSAVRSSLGVTTEEGYSDVQFTFRKTGKTDVTYTYRARCKSQATMDI